MLYDQVEQCYTVLAANFAADYAALLAAKSVASPGTVTIIKRQSVNTALRYSQAPPFVGVFSLAGKTQAKDQSKRDTEGLVAFDIYMTGAGATGASLVASQVELAAEAVLLTVDRLAGSGRGVYGAGELPFGTTVQLSDDTDEEVQQGLYGRRATVTVPVRDRDEPV